MTCLFHVDPDPKTRALVRAISTIVNTRLIQSITAEEALRKITDHRPKLVLTEIDLPGLDGIELLARLAQSKRKTKPKGILLTRFSPV